MACLGIRELVASAAGFLREGWQSLFKQQGRLAACNGVRALAMLWVIAFHALSELVMAKGTGHELFQRWWPVSAVMGGDVGVDLFLVLSGFLLGGSLFKDPCSNWLSFYAKRWFRIAPPYIAATLLGMLLDLPRGTREGCEAFGWSNLAFINNIYPKWGGLTPYPLCMVHTWSIAVEFQLYFATPLLFWLAMRVSRAAPSISFAAAASGLAGGVWLACACLRVSFVVAHGQSMVDTKLFSEPYVNTAYRMAPYAAGLVAGIAAQQHGNGLWSLGAPGTQWLWFLLSAVCLACSLAFGGEPMYMMQASGGAWYGQQFPRAALAQTALHRPLIGASAAYLLALAVTGEAPRLNRFLSASCWTPVAGLSYSVYLLQYVGWSVLLLPVLGWAKASLGGAPLAAQAALAYAMPLLALLGTLPFALANFLLVERGAMLLSKRLLERRPEQQKQVPVEKDLEAGKAQDDEAMSQCETTCDDDVTVSDEAWVAMSDNLSEAASNALSEVEASESMKSDIEAAPEDSV